jgi:hypothetical protein
MATTTEMLERLRSLNVRDLLVSSIEETAAEYVELNTRQMYQGLDGNGQKIQPTYRRQRYARVKNEMNSAPGYGVPDLKLTGAFYQGYGVRVEGDEVVKDSDVPYADDLFEKYGNAIGELDEDFHEEYVDGNLAPLFYDKVREETGLI